MSRELSYELSDQSKVNENGETLYRIRAVQNVSSEDHGSAFLGGWVSSARISSGAESIADDAWAHGNAQITGEARITRRALIFDDACIADRARVSDDAAVFCEA